jgi:hypothetical protein
MGIYDPLGAYLTKQSAPVVKMAFGEVEQIIGRTLPPSARNPQAVVGERVRGVALACQVVARCPQADQERRSERSHGGVREVADRNISRPRRAQN